MRIFVKRFRQVDFADRYMRKKFVKVFSLRAPESCCERILGKLFDLPTTRPLNTRQHSINSVDRNEAEIFLFLSLSSLRFPLCLSVTKCTTFSAVCVLEITEVEVLSHRRIAGLSVMGVLLVRLFYCFELVDYISYKSFT